MPLLRRHFGGGPRRNQPQVDVVDRHVGIVLGAPLLDVLVVEPLVISGDEVAPLKDFQRLFPGCMGRLCPTDRPDTSYQAGGRCGFDDVTTAEAATGNGRFFMCAVLRKAAR